MEKLFYILSALSAIKGLGFLFSGNIMETWANLYIRFIRFWVERKRMTASVCFLSAVVFYLIGRSL